jgi:hypothetical protein
MLRERLGHLFGLDEAWEKVIKEKMECQVVISRTLYIKRTKVYIPEDA